MNLSNFRTMFASVILLALTLFAIVVPATAQTLQIGAWSVGQNQTPSPGFINLTSTQNAATVAASYGYTLKDPLSGSCGPDYFPYVAFGQERKYYTVQNIPRTIGYQRILKLWKQYCYALQPPG